MNTRTFVKIQTFTWSKDSHGLFDYESSQLFNGKFKMVNGGTFYRQQSRIHMSENEVPDEKAKTEKMDYLFEVLQSPENKSKYYLKFDREAQKKHGLGIVVRGIKVDGSPIGHELKVGNHVNIGRVSFIVREIRDIDGNIKRIDSPQEIDFIKPSGLDEEHQGEPRTCRICLSDTVSDDPEENILISPCRCKGSCQYVHLKCMKQWIDSKKSKIEGSNNICLSFNFKKLSCEICKDPLPYSVKIAGNEEAIIDIKKPETTPYVLLEKIEVLKENRGLYLIKGQPEQQVKIGRGHTNNIWVSDISVSRNHSYIQYTNGQFRLFDNNSKFGTLVQIAEPIEITSQKTIVQCGKSVIILSIKKENIVPEEIKAEEEIVEVSDTPGTPSTINENAEESKNDGEIKLRRSSRRRAKRQSSEVSLTQPTMSQQQSLQTQGTIDETTLIENKVQKSSKKIFKIVRNNGEEQIGSPSALPGQGRPKRGQGKRRV